MKLKNIVFSFATTLAAITLLGTQLWATSLSFVPSASTIGVGDTTTVEIKIDGLDAVDLYGLVFFEPADLAAFSFDITYDDTVLSIDSYFFGNELGIETEGLFPDYVDDSKGSKSDNGPGHYDLAQVSMLWDLTSQGDSFTLATLNISGLALDQSSLGFSSVVLGEF